MRPSRNTSAVTSSVTVQALTIDASQNADPAQDRDDARGLAIFLKAACGIALGVGMSSRVLFPALVTGAQKRLRRLRRQPRKL